MRKRSGIIFILSILLLLSGNIFAQDTINIDSTEVHQCDKHPITDSTQAVNLTGEEPLRAGEHDENETVATIETSEPDQPPTVMDFLSSGKYLAFLILSAIAFIVLLTRKVNYWIRLALLAVAFILFGLDYFYPLHPSPMCAITKLFMFRFTWGEFFPAFVAMFVAIFLPSLIGRKIFCGWVCPLGALQDLINKIPFKWRIKNFNFTVFNSVRGTLLLMFVLVFFGVKDHLVWLSTDMNINPTEQMWVAYSAYSIYEPINFFELLHWGFNFSFFIMFPLLVITSLIFYRPFCYSICPIGFLTWLFEKIAPGRVRVDHSKCNDCQLCYDKSPCPTIKPMVEKSAILPDCTSCGECFDTCPQNAIKFSFFPDKH